MSYNFYLVLHLVGVFLVLLPLGGIAVHVMNGGTRNYASRKFNGMLHGIGLLISLVGGFGLLARLGIINGFPGWAIVKLGVWLLLGMMPMLFYRKARLAKILLLTVVALAGLAAAMAVYKPMFASAQTTEEETTNPSAPAMENSAPEGEASEAAPAPAEVPANAEVE